MIYLDYAATSPLRPLVIDAANELCREPLGNASSLHSAGRRARQHLEQARERCARALGAKVEEIVFCSGATEADNLAVLGTLGHPESRHCSLITSYLEHPAVTECAQLVQKAGQPVAWVNVTRNGQLDIDSLESHLQANPASLVTIIATNNEIGSRQPLAPIADLCHRHGALVHVDAVQEPRAAVDAIRSGHADLVALSGHKMGGLPAGLLYVRQGIPLEARVLGGGQEDHRRAGTSDILRAATLAIALDETLAERDFSILAARQALENELSKLPHAFRLGPHESSERAEHISSWLFGSLPAEQILAQLDLRGVCASSGSACSSHAVEPSRILKAMGFHEQAMGLVRFSMGWKTTIDDAVKAAEAVRDVVNDMLERLERA